MKAGLLDKKYAKRFSTISAWAELVGYVGNVTLNSLRIAAALERELMLTEELVRRKKVHSPYKLPMRGTLTHTRSHKKPQLG